MPNKYERYIYIFIRNFVKKQLVSTNMYIYVQEKPFFLHFLSKLKNLHIAIFKSS